MAQEKLIIDKVVVEKFINHVAKSMTYHDCAAAIQEISQNIQVYDESKIIVDFLQKGIEPIEGVDVHKWRDDVIAAAKAYREGHPITLPVPSFMAKKGEKK